MPPKTIRRVARILGPLFLFLFLGTGTAVADVQGDLVNAEERIEELSKRLEELRGRFVRPLEARSGDYFKTRLQAARFQHKQGFYEESAVILIDLLNTTKDVENHPNYYDICWLIGDSFYQMAYYQDAIKWLELLVYDKGQVHPQFKEAVVRLIDIALRVEEATDGGGKTDNAEKYYSLLSRTEGSAGWDMIQYAHGKSLFFKAETAEGQRQADFLQKAERTFRRIPETSEKRIEADYFIATILVKQGKLKEAMDIFNKLRAIDAKEENKRKVKELATLATARILIESQEYEEALSVYREIPIDSAFVDQAYYELCRIYIEKGKFEQAALTMDMLLGSLKDSMYSPDFMVLKGNVHLWDRNYSQADEAFKTVDAKYSSVIGEMDKLLDESTGLKAEQIQAMILGHAVTLPHIAVQWLQQEKSVTKAMDLESDLQESEDNAVAGQKIIGTLRRNLKQESKANIFLNMREGRERGLAIRNQLTESRRELVTISTALVGERIPAASRKRLEELQTEKKRLEELWAKIPKTVQQREERRGQFVGQMEMLEKTIHQLKLQVDDFQTVINDVMARHEHLRGNPKISQTYLGKVKKEVNDFRSFHADLKQTVEELEREVNRQLDDIRIGDTANRQDEVIRRELDAVVAEEKDLLAEMQTMLTPSGLLLFNRIEQAKTRSDKLDKDVLAFFDELEVLVSKHVKKLDQQVTEEEKKLKDYSKALADLQNRSTELAAQIARVNLKVVRQHFYDIVLQANVGLIDTAWEEREEIRADVDALLETRSTEKQRLTNSFEELRND